MTYLMGNLPEFRVNDYAPFIYVWRPFSIKNRKTRGPKIIKGYVCLFICMSTKAIHLELVTWLFLKDLLIGGGNLVIHIPIMP